MSKNTKHTYKMQTHFRKFVVITGGEYTETCRRSGIKDTYIIGKNKVSHKWHSSPSSSNVVKYKHSDLNRMSRTLGIESEWHTYKKDNTICMLNSPIGDSL